MLEVRRLLFILSRDNGDVCVELILLPALNFRTSSSRCHQLALGSSCFIKPFITPFHPSLSRRTVSATITNMVSPHIKSLPAPAVRSDFPSTALRTFAGPFAGGAFRTGLTRQLGGLSARRSSMASGSWAGQLELTVPVLSQKVKCCGRAVTLNFMPAARY
jgi:hypothetical protein